MLLFFFLLKKKKTNNALALLTRRCPPAPPAPESTSPGRSALRRPRLPRPRPSPPPHPVLQEGKYQVGKIKEPGRALEIRPQLSGQARALVSEWAAGSKRAPPVRGGQGPQFPPPPLRGAAAVPASTHGRAGLRQGPSALPRGPKLEQQ